MESYQSQYTAEQIESLITNGVPRINSTNKHWEVWDVNAMQWVDTGIVSEGAPGNGDMNKSVYDTNNDGIVDNASKLGGHAASYFSIKSSLYTVTLGSGDWVDNAQTKPVSGLATSGYAYTVAPASTSFAIWADAVVWADDVTTANTITFHCNKTPSDDITATILKVQI